MNLESGFALTGEFIEDWINDDPDYKELIIDYLKEEKQTITYLQEALEKKDFSKIAYVADMIYGHGGSIGFPLISVIGKAMIVSAKSQDASQINILIAKLGKYLNFLSEYY